MRFMTTLALGLVVVVLIVVGANLDTINYFVAQLLTGLLEFLRILAWLSLALGAAAGGVIVVQYYRNKETNRLRQKDGSFPLRVYKISGGGEVALNLNNITGIGAVWHPAYGLKELAGAYPDEIQADIRKAVERTHQLQAMSPGDDAISSKFGSLFRGGSGGVDGATGKLLAGAFDRQPRALPAPVAAPDPMAAQIIPPTPPAFDRVAQTAITKQQVALGYRWADNQSKYTVAPWNPIERPILGILGSTRQGKTSGVGIAVASQLALQGWHTLILDPEREGTWAILAPWTEYHRTDHTILIDQLAAVQGEYQRRGDIMQAHAVDDAVRLPPGVLPFFALIIEELGRLRETLPAAEKSEFDNQISNLVRVGGKRGMAIVVIDQHYKSYDGQWPAVLRQNALRLSYRQEVEDYNLVRVDGLSQLERGQFAYRGQIWHSWDARTAAIPLLSRQSLPKHPAIINGTATPVTLSPDHSVTLSPAFAQEVAPPPPAPSNAPAERDEETRLAILAYLDAHPKASQADVRRALHTSTGYTHQIWHEWHNARNSQPAPRPAAIPDALHGWREIVESDNPASLEQMEAIRQAIAAGKITVG